MSNKLCKLKNYEANPKRLWISEEDKIQTERSSLVLALIFGIELDKKFSLMCLYKSAWRAVDAHGYDLFSISPSVLQGHMQLT